MVVTVDLGAREEDHPELQLLLETEHVLGPDHVGLPEVLVVVFAVPAAVLGGEVVDVVEPGALEDPLQLPVTPRIRPDVILPVSIHEVSCNDLVAPPAQFVDEVSADEPRPARDKNPLCLHCSSPNHRLSSPAMTPSQIPRILLPAMPSP